MKLFKIKVHPKGETWEEMGRTIYLPKSQAPTAIYARGEALDLLKKGWVVESVEEVELQRP